MPPRRWHPTPTRSSIWSTTSWPNQHHDGRYYMLETIRHYGWQLLEEEGELHQARQAHLAWLAALARAGGRELEGRDQLKWLRRFQVEIDNIRAGLAFARDHDPVTGAIAAGSLTRFFWMNAMEADTHKLTDARSFLAEGYDWSVALLETAGDRLPAKNRARLQSGLGGMLCVRTGRYPEGIERLSEAQAIFEELGDQRGLGWALFYDGIAGWSLRSLEETVDRFRRALRNHTEAGDRAGQLFATLLLGWGLGASGELAEGREHIDRYVQAADAIGVPNLVAHGGEAVAMFDGWQGSITEASRRKAVESLEAFRSINNYACMTHSLGTAALMLVAMGDLEAPGIVIGISQAIRERLNMVLAPYEDRTQYAANAHAAAVAAKGLRTQSPDEDWETAIARGRTMEPDEGIDWTIQRLSHPVAQS